MSTKSLGTLTLDLVAKTGSFVQGMTKSQRSAQKWRKGVERDLKRVGTAMAGLGTIAAGAFSAMVVQTVNGARELERFAQISDTSTQSFQRLAYGSSRFGIDQEKLADILKDTNDRIGDFLATGGGPMADFFENIAPKVGVTADEFARLSGPDALQLYVASLEAAGLSQKDMTFYMEAIASDATALIPLLADGGKEMRRLGDEAERTGNVFSDMEMQQLIAIKDGMDELTGAATGMKNEMVLGALPAIEDMVELLSDPETLKNAQALGEAIVTSMEWAIEALQSTISFAQNLGTELGVIAVGIGGLELEEQRARIMSALENPSERVRLFGPEGIIKYHSEAELKAALDDIDAQIKQRAEGMAISFGDRGAGDADPGDGRSMMEVFIGEGMELASTGLARVGQAADGAADALDGFSPAANDEVEDILDRAGEGSSIDASGQIRDAWGNTLPTLQRELDAALEQQVADFRSAQNLQAGLEAAAQAFVDGASVAAKAAWNSIQPANGEDAAGGVVPTAEQAANGTSTIRWSTDLGAEKVSQAASQVSGRASGGGGIKQLGTLTLKSEAGNLDVFTENAEAAEKWLADTLAGVVAGSR
ncbi:hypothetical protein [Halomonas rhizosphaerae]|uniref:Bacteriophage tail tape measure N-terminal domain-containing protein n=1 Tax=Halomonas rhizosphaerae TaxID=3043296 RepID=A0ABT6UX90_9GAMM|nr:hypothetical protein [Halomonas rhizosphaerae]MDI5890597.1 hypothetical protein [Halomonas rhizosphaerae]